MPGLLPDVDPDGLLEFSVVYTDRALNHMSKRFIGVAHKLLVLSLQSRLQVLQQGDEVFLLKLFKVHFLHPTDFIPVNKDLPLRFPFVISVDRIRSNTVRARTVLSRAPRMNTTQINVIIDVNVIYTEHFMDRRTLCYTNGPLKLTQRTCQALSLLPQRRHDATGQLTLKRRRHPSGCLLLFYDSDRALTS